MCSMTMFVAIAMAEIVSSLPSSGGRYFWCALHVTCPLMQLDLQSVQLQAKDSPCPVWSITLTHLGTAQGCGAEQQEVCALCGMDDRHVPSAAFASLIVFTISQKYTIICSLTTMLSVLMGEQAGSTCWVRYAGSLLPIPPVTKLGG